MTYEMRDTVTARVNATLTAPRQNGGQNWSADVSAISQNRLHWVYLPRLLERPAKDFSIQDCSTSLEVSVLVTETTKATTFMTNPGEDSNLASNIYRPGKNIDKEAYGGQDELDELRKTNRFVPDKEFSGTDRTTAGRSGPVQFEKDEDDPFGLDQFLDTAKRASNKRSSDGGDRRDRGGESSSKGRKDY